MGRIVVALVVLMWLGTAHAAPCVQRDLDAGVAAGQLFYNSPLQFEDGSAVRVKAPRPPENVRLAIAADHEQHNEWIAIDGDFDPAAKYVGVEINGYTMLTTPDQRYVCSRGTVLYDRVHVAKIFSIDRYGNRSDAVERNVVAIGGEHERHYRCGLGVFFAGMGSLVIATVLFLILILARSIGKLRPTGLCAPVSPVIAENVAHAVVRRYSIKFLIAVLTTTALWTFDHPFLAIQLSPFVVMWIIEVGMAQWVVHQFEKVHYLARRDDWILINSTKLHAPRRLWAKASTLPSAGLA